MIFLHNGSKRQEWITPSVGCTVFPLHDLGWIFCLYYSIFAMPVSTRMERKTALSPEKDKAVQKKANGRRKCGAMGFGAFFGKR